MKTFITLFFVLIHACAFAQPVIQWQKVYGSSAYDAPYGGIIQTSDGGYLLSGYSDGADQDKTFSNGAYDYWVIRLNASGDKIWEKSFGGSNNEFFGAAIETQDGGFLLGGYSNSPMSGDKTEDSKGEYDYWVVKITGSGDVVWEKTIGSPAYDVLSSVVLTGDGNYALAGYSNAIAGGDKSAIRGGQDFWVVMIDDAGIILSEKVYGGADNDLLLSMVSTNDGGFIMSGYSYSSTSFDKSEDSRGANDYWVVRTDANGNKLWDKTLGGSALDFGTAVAETADGGFLVGGYSDSGPGFDKTQTPRGGLTSNSDYETDFWIVKLNSSGAFQWDKTLGTAGTDVLRSISPLPDGYLLGGESSGNASFDKSEDSRGEADNWIVKVDVSGNKIWDKTVGGNATDVLINACAVALTSDGGLVFASHSYSPVSGDKTVEGKGSSDYWIVKLSGTPDVENDPSGRFITGGGWFHSPAGAYASDEDAEGKAHFGFVAKYQKGGVVPVGNTTFGFKGGDISFKSTSYESLVIAGQKAIFKGTGEFNGTSGYGFLVSATDGGKRSSTEDKFRIKIWDTFGAVVYDNEGGAPDDVEAVTGLGGGSIVIHEGKNKDRTSSDSRPASDETAHGAESELSAYPNPIGGVLTVSFPSSVKMDVDIQLMNVFGMKVYEIKHSFDESGLYRVELGTQIVGREVYFIKVQQGRRMKFLKVMGR
ncbi:MAG: hypothetical protein WEB30_04165 [Cyclobacteriaceae bacterium]